MTLSSIVVKAKPMPTTAAATEKATAMNDELRASS